MEHDNTFTSPCSADLSPSREELRARYGHYFKDMQISEQEAQDYLSALWTIMLCFADVEGGINLVDNLIPKCDASMNDMVDCSHPEETAPETLASPKQPKTEEQP